MSTPEAWLAFRRDITADAASLRLLHEGTEAASKTDRLNVMEKQAPPPSGDSHDYASIAPYYWPDPAKPDGLPYLNRDGEVNPEYFKTDRPRLGRLCDAVTVLTLSSFATPTAPSLASHAAKAGKLLRGWFLDDATRMNPNLKFGQAIGGRRTGGATGIIDTVCLCFLVDALGRLPWSVEWEEKHEAALRNWFSEYLDWLLKSEFGREERAHENNHGTWYDAQVAAFALFCGRKEVARRQIEKFTLARIKSQIQPDGRQPFELKRTQSLTYSTFNLLGFVCLAQMARQVELDLWSQPELLAALRFLVPYYVGEKRWTGQQIHEFRKPTATLLVNLAAQGTGQEDLIKSAPAVGGALWNRVSFYGAAPRDNQPGQ